MRLIDADALLASEWDLCDAVEAIKNAPTVDAVPVVRCKDCDGKDCWYKDDNGNDICWISGMYPKGENDFCSCGERKDDDK